MDKKATVGELYDILAKCSREEKLILTLFLTNELILGKDYPDQANSFEFLVSNLYSEELKNRIEGEKTF